jgi:hypothetical protein
MKCRLEAQCCMCVEKVQGLEEKDVLLALGRQLRKGPRAVAPVFVSEVEALPR